MIEYTFNNDTIGFFDMAGISFWTYLNGEKTIWDIVVEQPDYTFVLWKDSEGPFLTETLSSNTMTEELAFQIYTIIKQN